MAMVQDTRTRGNGLKQERVTLERGRNYSSIRTVKCWKLFPREHALALTWNGIKMCLDKALSTLSDPALSRRLVQTPPEVPSSLNDAVLPSPSCLQTRESAQVLPDPRSHAHQVQGCFTGVPKQPSPHPLLPLSFAQSQLLLFSYPYTLQK